MAQDNVGQTAKAQENQDPVSEAFIRTAKDRSALEGLIGPLFRHLYTDFLDILFEVFPHEKGDGSNNEQTYMRLRHRVLNLGNRKQREVGTLLRDFIVYQIRERVVTVVQKIKGQGPWNLPPGVKMPADRK